MLSKDPSSGAVTIDAYVPANNGPSPSRSIGPISPSRGTPTGGITVDSDGKVYVNFKDGRNRNSVDVYSANASGAAAPERSVATPVQGGYVTAIAIGPLVTSTPPPTPRGTLYVLNGNVVDAFALSANGAAAPQRSITVLAPDYAGGPAYQYAQSMATTSDGRLFVVRNTDPSPGPAVCSIAEYRADANGANGLLSQTACLPSNEATTLLARGPSGLVDEARLFFYPTEYTEIRRGVPPTSSDVFSLPYVAYAFATDPRGEMYVETYSTPTTMSTISEYAPNAPNGAAPVRTITLGGVLAVAADGTLYAGGGSRPGPGPLAMGQILVVPPGATSPARTITLPDLALVPVSGLAVDSAGELFVAGTDASGNNYVKVFAPGASGNATPIRTILNVAPNGPIYAMAVFE